MAEYHLSEKSVKYIFLAYILKKTLLASHAKMELFKTHATF